MTNLERLLQLTTEELELEHTITERNFLCGKLAGLKLASQCRLTAAELALIDYILDENVSPSEGTDDLSVLVQKLREERCK